MARLGEPDLLTLFERGKSADPLHRAWLFGAALLGERVVETAPISDVDRAAWSSRAQLIGGPMEAICTCPACQARLEIELPANFALPERINDDARVNFRGTAYAIRLPRMSDVTARGVAVERLSPDAPWENTAFRADAEAALEAADPALNIRIQLTCQDCGLVADRPFDPLAYVWAELEDRARRLITQITRLARAYGWAERDILAMSPRRRALYEAEISS